MNGLRYLTYIFIFGSCGLATCWLVGQPSSADSPARLEHLSKSILSSQDSPSGLCVHLEPRDGKLTTALSGNGQNLVHALTSSENVVKTVRETIRSANLEGAVSVEKSSLDKLPYADRIVNLIVADQFPKLLDAGLNIDEVLRVLSPGGTAWLGVRESDQPTSLNENQLTAALKQAGISDFKIRTEHGLWAVVTKPRPANLDAWTHKRHDPSGNPVSNDQMIGLPSGVRWVAGPNWPTGDRKSVIPGAVASENRLVYIFEDEEQTDDGVNRFDSLVARDGFNGLFLWKRKTTKQSRALVSAGDRVYTVVQDYGPLVALDGNTGEIVKSYKGTKTPRQVALAKGDLVVDLPDGLASFNAETGALNWKFQPRPEKFLMGDGHVFVQTIARASTGERISKIASLNLATGKEEWSEPTKSWSKSQPSLIFYQEGVLVVSSSDGNHGISAKDGSHLWQYKYPRIGHGGSFEKVLSMHGLVWVHTAAFDDSKRYAWEGLDPQTGKVKKRLIQPKNFTYKHRCNYDVATKRYFVCGSMDFADLETGEYSHFTAARNSCRTGGVVPANGLMYTFPHACGCFPMLRGFMGLAETPAPELVTPDTSSQRLVKGSAYGESIESGTESASDWPTYRRDNLRSGGTSSPGPKELKALWNAQVAAEGSRSLEAEWDLKNGGRMTSPVVADGLAFVAATDNHRLAAFDAQTGILAWEYTAGGRIDCPPTIHQGRCVFGSRDGWIYCLRASTGALIWKFRAAPDPRRIVAYGQLESPWPIVGGVLVDESLAYFVAGRHEGSDGGVFVHAVDLATGSLVWVNRPKDYTGVPDVLNAEEGTIQMAGYSFDAKTGEKKMSQEARMRGGRLGLLNDAWYKRPIALRKNLQLWTGGNKSGQIFTFNPQATCGFRACEKVNGGNGQMSGDAVLFSLPLDDQSASRWQVKMSNTSRIKGMVIAANRLYVAGRFEMDGKMGHAIRAYSLTTGKPLDEFPVQEAFIHDGLAVANGRVYVTTQGGKLICLGEQ